MSRCPWIVTLAPLLVLACHPNEETFNKTVFSCEASAARQQCGKTDDGHPLTCWPGKQLGGGRDFCVSPCAGALATPSGNVCVAERNAGLRTCRPSAAPGDPEGCGDSLSCYRTDLVRDEGVCLAMHVCSNDADCKDAVLSTCASSVLAATFPRAHLQTSNLQCVVAGCKARQTACPVGETCLPSVVPSTTPVPDICVPNCDSTLNCPPNYACWRRLSGPTSPNVCLPTLLGARCNSSIDCMVGDCLDTGEGFSLCATRCESDHDCALYSESSHKLYCLPRGDAKYCIAISPFAGTFCLADENCPQGQKCYFTSLFFPTPMKLGECREPCGPDERCRTRGGYTNSCFKKLGVASCYPGVMGVTCLDDRDCLRGTCHALGPERRFRGQDAGAPSSGDGGASEQSFCTLACTTDVDCLDAWNNQEGYCEDGWCRLGEGAGGPCTRDQQCGRGHCENAGMTGDGVATGHCVYPP